MNGSGAIRFLLVEGESNSSILEEMVKKTQLQVKRVVY